MTHNFEEALVVADKIAVINEGRILQADSTEKIFNEPKNKFIADFVGFRNVYAGNIKDNIFKINDSKFYIPSEDCSNAYIAIKSDDILLSKDKIISSARNSFKGKVTNIQKKVSIVEITVNIGVDIHADITYKSLSELNLIKDQNIWITFKSSSILIFKH